MSDRNIIFANNAEAIAAAHSNRRLLSTEEDLFSTITEDHRRKLLQSTSFSWVGMLAACVPCFDLSCAQQPYCREGQIDSSQGSRKLRFVLCPLHYFPNGGRKRVRRIVITSILGTACDFEKYAAPVSLARATQGQHPRNLLRNLQNMAL